jgi:hypothetical protein
MDFRLVDLDCPSCGSAMTGGPHDILFLCTHCGSGAVLSEVGLETVTSTALMPAPGRVARLWRPAWTIETDVTVTDRIRYGGRPTPGSSGRRTFVIPAFALDLADFTRLAQALSAVSGSVGEVPEEPCPGGTLHLEDARTLARYLVVGAEVKKPDTLASVRIELTPVTHRLTALPFTRDGALLQCSVTGVKVAEPN